MTMQGGTARDRLRARAQAMYGGKRREDEEQQNRQNQRQEAETPAVGSARDRLRQRASAMGVVTGQGANTQEPTQERSRLTVEGYEAAIKGMQERMGGQTGLTKSGIVQHTQSRETEKWRQEQEKKYSGLREQADYAKKSTKVDQSLASGKGAYIFGHYVGKGDDVYSYINSIGTAYENRSNAGQTPSGKLAKYAYMTDDEVADYNYLYQTKGKEEAEKYLEYMGTELDARRAAGFSQWNSELAEKAPVLASAASVPMNLTSGVGLVGVGLQNIRNQVTGEYKPINYYSPAMDATVASTAIRGTRAQHLADKYGTIQMDEKEHPLLSRIFNGKSWGDVYQLGMSMVDSAAAAGIGQGTGLTAAGTALLGGSAGSQGVLDAVERGATDSQALTMGILNATFESLFEYVSLDHLLKGNTKNILKGFLKQGFIEGSEEWNTTLFNTIADVLVMAENSDYKTSVRDYMEQGYSEKEAERQAMFDIAVGMGWDFVGGAISGGLMDTGKQIVRDAKYKSKFGKASGDIVAEAQEVAPGTALTQKAQERIDAGKSLTGHQIVNLLQQNEDAIRTGDMVTIRNAVAERLAQYGESQNIDRVADAITKQVAGEKLSGKEKALVESSTYGQRILNEMNPENISEGGFNSDWAGQLGTTQINAEAYSQKLREAQAETQQEEPQQTERQEMTPEEMAVLSAWNSEAESSPANSTTVQPTLGDSETLKALGVKTGSQLRAEVRQALTERQAAKQEAQQRTQVAQQTQETQETARQAQGEPVTLEEASKAYGKQAKAFLRTYQQGQDVEKFSEAYRIAHEMGESNVPYRVVQGLRSLDYLTEAQKDIAYRTGASAEQQGSGGKKATWRKQGVVRAENGAKLSDLSKTFNVPQKQGYKILSDISKATGVDIVLYRSKGDADGNITEAEGRFRRSENTIYIDVNSGIDNVNSAADFSQYTMLRTFNHEFTHFIEQNADEEYRELRKLVFEAMQEKLDGQEGGVTVDDLIREKQDKYRQALGQEISYDEASREVVADAMTDILPDSHFMETLYNRNATLAEKLIGKLKDFIAKVKAYFDGLTTNTKAEAALLKEMRDGGLHYLERIVEAYDKAATAAVENYQGAETRSEGGEDQYMARGRYWRPQLKQAEWDLLERRMNAEIKSGENFLDEATKWVYADEKGVQVFALYGIGDGTEATPLYAVGGKQAVKKAKNINVYMEGSNNDGSTVDFKRWLEEHQHSRMGQGGSVLRSGRGGRNGDENGRIHSRQHERNAGGVAGRGTENQRGVKDQFSLRDSEGRSLTEAQQDYFKDSKVRDAEGRLKVVYHGSGAVFTKFSADFMSQNGSSEGQGFYFTDYKPMAEGYSKKGGQLLEGYLDMKKPLSDSEVTLTSAEVRKLIKAIDPTGDDLVLNYDSKGGMGYPSRAWYNRSVEDTLRATMSTSDSDSEILAELANGMGNPGAVLKAAREVLGYDGYIVEGKYDNATVYVAFDSSQFKNVDNQSPTADPDIRYSIREIKGEDGTDYGKGVYLDSTLLEGLTDAERKEMMRERVKELGGQTITAYDPNGEAVDIRIAAPSEKFRNRNGRRVPVTNDLARKNRDVKVKQESVVLADELIATSQYKRPRKAKYPHGWLDNNGKNDWQYWTTYIQDKNNTVWEATLNVAESANGVKYLYDISPIKKVGQPVKSGTSTTLVGQPVKSGTSTTGNIVAQDQTESQAQIRSSTLSDRDVLRIAAQMAKNSESRSLTDADRARLGILEQKLGRIDEAEEQRQGFLEEKRAILAGREAKELSDAERAQLRKVQKNLDTVNGKIRRLNEELSQTQEKKVVKALLKKARVVVERDAVQRGVARLNEYKNRRSAAELRTSIKKTAKAFQQMLLHPTGTKYAPESLIQSCFDVATMLDTSGEREDTKAKAQYRSMMDALNTLKTQYDDLKNNPDSDFRGEYDTNFAYMVEQLAKRLGGKPVRDLTLTELQDVHSVLRDIQTMLRNAKYQIGQAERITNYAVGESIIRDMEKIPERTVAERAMDTTSRLTISPLRNIRRLTMYNDNSQLVRLFDALNDGIRKKNRFMMECDKLFERFLGKRFRKAAGLVKSYNVGTRTFKMTEMEAIQLVLTWEREAHGETSHLAKGGFIIPNHYLLKKGKFEDAFLKGTTYSHVQQSEIDAIQRTFDKWALDYKAAVKNEFFNGIAKNAINNTTLQLKGRAVALTPDYVSIEVDKNSVVTELEGVKFDATIEGMGMLKSVVKGASNPVIIRGVHSLVESHIERVGQLYGLAIPIRNFNKAYNVKTVDGTSSVRGAIGKTWSAADLKMIEQAISDLQTPRKRADVFDKMVRKATSSFVKAKLLSNISVTIKQAASYSTAGLYLSQKALFPYQTTVVGLFVSNKSKFAKKLFAEIDEHTAEHYIRRKGMSMQEINTIAKDNSKIVRDMDENLPDAANPLKWIQNMDVATTAALWLATKKQVALDGMKTTDPGYWDAVTSLYEKVIEETQPMYDTLHRPEVQRTPNEIVRGVLMFRTQPLQNTGILYDAFGELNQAVKSKDAEWVKRARKKAAMAVGSQLASLAVFSVMTMLAGAAKNRLYRYLNNEDELTIQSIMLRVLGDMATNGAGLLIPIGGSELAELVEKQLTGSSYGGEFSVSVVDMLNDYIDQFGKCWKDVADLNDGGREKLPTDLRDLSMDTAGLFGIPAENVFNIIRGVVGNISDTFSEEPIQWATDIPDPNVSAIKAAFDNGHMDTAKDKIVELIAFKVKSGKTEKEAASSVRSSITSYYKPLYLKALRSGDKEEMRRIASIIKASGLYSEGADATLEKWASAAD